MTQPPSAPACFETHCKVNILLSTHGLAPTSLGHFLCLLWRLNPAETRDPCFGTLCLGAFEHIRKHCFAIPPMARNKPLWDPLLGTYNNDRKVRGILWSNNQLRLSTMVVCVVFLAVLRVSCCRHLATTHCVDYIYIYYVFVACIISFEKM